MHLASSVLVVGLALAEPAPATSPPPASYPDAVPGAPASFPPEEGSTASMASSTPSAEPVEPAPSASTSASTSTPPSTPTSTKSKAKRPAKEPSKDAAPPCPPRDPACATAPGEPLLESVPRQLFIGLGWAYDVVDHLPDPKTSDAPHPNGIGSFFTYTWQVGGLGWRRPSWLGFHLGLDYFPTSARSLSSTALSYGLYVKHGLGRHPRARPFFTYGLGAVQAWVRSVDGRGIGHQTRLSAGVDLPVSPRVAISLELAYKYQSLPIFQVAGAAAERYDFHTLLLLDGSTFDFPGKVKPPPRRRRHRGRR